jgi:ketosteroid isomerase-like protein
MRKLLALCLLVALSGCAAPDLNRSEIAVEEQALEGRFEAWVSSINNFNGSFDDINDKFIQSEDLVVVSPNGNRVEGWENQAPEISSYYQNVTYVNFVPLAPAVHVINGEFATIVYRHSTTTDYRMTGRAANAGWGMMLWQKDADGQWRILTSVMSNNSL